MVDLVNQYVAHLGCFQVLMPLLLCVNVFGDIEMVFCTFDPLYTLNCMLLYLIKLNF